MHLGLVCNFAFVQQWNFPKLKNISCYSLCSPLWDLCPRSLWQVTFWQMSKRIFFCGHKRKAFSDPWTLKVESVWMMERYLATSIERWMERNEELRDDGQVSLFLFPCPDWKGSDGLILIVFTKKKHLRSRNEIIKETWLTCDSVDL